MEHRRHVQELTVERDPVKRGDGRAPRVGTTGMVAQRRRQEVLRGTSASLAKAESGGTRRAGSTELRRPECIRSTIARRPASIPSSPRRSGRASVRHSRAVSLPGRSAHRMDPIGSAGVAGSWAPRFGGVAVGWRAAAEPELTGSAGRRARHDRCSRSERHANRSRLQSASGLSVGATRGRVRRRGTRGCACRGR